MNDDVETMVAAETLDELRDQGRVVTRVVMVLETVGMNEGDELAALHFRASDNCPTWVAHGMLVWACDQNEANLLGDAHDE